MDHQTRGSIAWFGLGRFGLPVATHLLGSGYSILIGNEHRSVDNARILANHGARVLERGDVVDAFAACVPTPADVAELLASMTNPPRYFIDFGTGSPQEGRRFFADFAARGTRYVDAPVSGSIEAAGSGQLTCWAGLHDYDLDEFLGPLLRRVAAKLYFMGSAGQGFAAKLVNQVIHISTMAAIGDGLALGREFGLDTGVLVESLQTASADSVMLRRFGPSIAAGDFSPRFSAAMALKDIELAVEAASGDEPLPSLGVVRDRLRALVELSGTATVDFSALAAPDPRCPRSPAEPQPSVALR